MREENQPHKGLQFVPLPPAVRMVVLLAGHVSLLLGLIALLLPIIPTTPFLLVAAACYARTSERFYTKLIENKYCGPAILRWREEKCIEPRAKVFAMALLATAFVSTSFLFLESMLARSIMLAVGLTVVVIIHFIPSCDVKNP